MDSSLLVKYIRTEFPKRFKRPELDQEQLAFLMGLVPFGVIMQRQTYLKCQGRIATKNGIYASVIIADIICRSNWGKLAPAEELSNLGMLTRDTPPKIKSKSKLWQGEYYRKYDSWFDFTTDMTDHYIFSGYYTKVLSGKNSDIQSLEMEKVVSLQKVNYYDNILKVIADYGLTEFDSFYS